MKKIDLETLKQILYSCYSKETAYPSCQKDWVQDDPTYGQCAVTAMIVHDYFGGTINRIRVDGGGTHYFNKIDGKIVDFTREQFDLYDIPIKYEPNEEMNLDYVGKNKDTKSRYDLLKSRVDKLIGEMVDE